MALAQKTVTLADGVSVTVQQANGWHALRRQVLWARLQMPETEPTTESASLREYVTWYVICVAHTVSTEGLDWSPPASLFLTTKEAQDNFEAWIKALPNGAADVTAWLDAVTEVNRAPNPPELQPDWEPDPTEADQDAEKK